MMNDSNQISKVTKLFGYIGEYAGVSRFSAVANKMFKKDSVDAMMIPMNIREDDLYFTVTNMKKSQVNGAIISSEYVDKILNTLDSSSSMVTRSGMCDIVYREGETLRGDIFSIRVLTEHLKDMMLSKIAVIGVNHYAKAFSFLSCGFNVSYFNENLEELMNFTTEVELKNADINRIANGMEVDFSTYDAVLDFSDMDNLSMVTSLASFNFDMKNTKQTSVLKARSIGLEASYTSYDDIVDKLCKTACINIIKNK